MKVRNPAASTHGTQVARRWSSALARSWWCLPTALSCSIFMSCCPTRSTASADGVVGAGLRCDDRLGVLGDFVEVRLDVLVEALGLVEGRVGLRLEPACEFLFAVADEGVGQVVVLGGHGLPQVAGGAETLVLFGGHASVDNARRRTHPGNPELGGLLRGKSRLPVLTGFLRAGAADCDVCQRHGARLFRLVDYLVV